MEWMTEKGGKYPPDPDLDTPRDHHRHTSHLFGLYPGRQIGVEKTPKLAAAAKVTLDARGETGDVREWSFAWRTALYGRLHDGESAHRMFQQLFSARNTCPNLFGLHPPMQMDGNFGITAAIAELLVDSHEEDINLLPALPSAWPSGEIKGLRARGGFVVNVAWIDGKLSHATIRASKASTVRVKSGDRETALHFRSGESIRLSADLKPD
jgi:alpha-L-fucosidase 2